MCSNVLQPNPPYTIQHGFLSFSLTHSTLSLSSNYVPRIALLQDPKKIPSSSLVFQKINFFFHRVMWAFWGSLSWSEIFTEKTGKARTFLPVPTLFSLVPLSHLSLSFALFSSSSSSLSF
ncbi:hypothetical protein S83_002204 [Arachis hypogaea]